MERTSLRNLLVAGTLFVLSTLPQSTNSAEPNSCLASSANDFAVEFNSIKYGKSEYTRQNVQNFCYAASSSRVVEGVNSLLECSAAAYEAGMNSFSFSGGVCEISSFWVSQNSTDVLIPIPPMNVSTEVVYIAWDPVNAASIPDEMESGFPSIKNVTWNLISESPLRLDVTISIEGRLCYVDSALWVGTNDVSENVLDEGPIDLDGKNEVTFAIQSESDLCDFAEIFTSITLVSSPDGVRNTSRDYFKRLNVGFPRMMVFEWINLNLTFNETEFNFNLTTNNYSLTRIEIFNSHQVFFNTTSIPSIGTSLFNSSIPANGLKCDRRLTIDQFSEFGCLRERLRILSSFVCRFWYLATIGTSTLPSTIDVYAQDYCKYCFFSPDSLQYSRNEASGFCVECQSRMDSGTLSLPKINSDESRYVFMDNADCEITWAGFKLRSGVWQWDDGDTSLNETEIDLSSFDQTGPACTVFSVENGTSVPKLLNYDCSSTVPCTKCMRFLPNSYRESIHQYLPYFM